MAVRELILACLFLGVYSLPLPTTDSGCYSFSHLVVVTYRAHGCQVEEFLPRCYKSPVCPRGCIGEDGTEHSVGTMWPDEAGNLKCNCLAATDYWHGNMPAVPSGGVPWPPGKECVYQGCQSPLDGTKVIKPNTEKKIGKQVCQCQMEKDDSGNISYSLNCA